MFNFRYQNGKKTKKWVKCSGLQNGAIRGLQIRAVFRDYKSGQEGLQIGGDLEISNWGKKITNRGRKFKLGQKDFKSGQRLQIRARGISNRGRDYKLVQNKCAFPLCLPEKSSCKIQHKFLLDGQHQILKHLQKIYHPYTFKF